MPLKTRGIPTRNFAKTKRETREIKGEEHKNFLTMCT